MELDLDALQELPAEEEMTGTCKHSCGATCPTTTCIATTSQL